MTLTHSHGGFTLPEMLLVTGIIALLLGILLATLELIDVLGGAMMLTERYLSN